jgi:deoxycytidine triphosphate deaminase
MASYGVLGTEEIRSRLDDIFKPATASKDCVDAASYNLRVAADGNFFAGNWHPIGDPIHTLWIDPGEMAVLSTIEEFTLPHDLTGSVNVKFKYTQKGLLSLFGSRVDPGFDRKRGGRRLYLFVCNIGSTPVEIEPGETVFIVEFATVIGAVSVPEWKDVNARIEQLCKQKVASGERQLGFLSDLGQLRNDYEKFKAEFRGLWHIYIFGILLLGVALISQLAPFALTWWQRHTEVQPSAREVQVTSSWIVPVAWPVISVAAESATIRRLPGDSHQVNDIMVVYRLISGTIKSRISRLDLMYIGSVKVSIVGSDTIQAVPVAETSLKAIRIGDITFSARID